MTSYIGRDIPGARGWQAAHPQNGLGERASGKHRVSGQNGLPGAPDRSDANYYSKLGLDRAQVRQLAQSDRIAGRELPPEPVHAKADSDFFGEDGFTFGDILDIVNPLQHLPVIGNLYREITGDEISEGAKLAGSGLYGGPIGLVGGLANTIVESTTGKSIAENAVALVSGEGDTQQIASVADFAPPQAASAQAAAPQAAAPQAAAPQAANPQAATPQASTPAVSAALARAAATAPDSAKLVELSEAIATGRTPGAAAPQPAQPAIQSDVGQTAFGGIVQLPAQGQPAFPLPPNGPPNVADAAGTNQQSAANSQPPNPQPAPAQLPDNAPVQLSGRAADVLLQLAEGTRPGPAAGPAITPPEGGGSDPDVGANEGVGAPPAGTPASTNDNAASNQSERAAEVLARLAAGEQPLPNSPNAALFRNIDNDDEVEPDEEVANDDAGDGNEADDSATQTAAEHRTLDETAAAFIAPPENIAKSMLDALKKYEALKSVNG